MDPRSQVIEFYNRDHQTLLEYHTPHLMPRVEEEMLVRSKMSEILQHRSERISICEEENQPTEGDCGSPVRTLRTPPPRRPIPTCKARSGQD